MLTIQTPPKSPRPSPPPAQSPQTRVEMSATGLNSSYANFFRFNGTYEELLVDFGIFTGLLTTTGPEPIKLTQRIILSFPTAKRLLAGLQLAIAKHELQFGPIEVDPQKRSRKT